MTRPVSRKRRYHSTVGGRSFMKMLGLGASMLGVGTDTGLAESFALIGSDVAAVRAWAGGGGAPDACRDAAGAR